MVTRAEPPTEQGEATGRRPKLAGCPFCGSTRLVICGSGPLTAAPFAVACTTVDCHGAIWALGHHKFDSREEAIAAWNRRPAPQPLKVTEGELPATDKDTAGKVERLIRQWADDPMWADHVEVRKDSLLKVADLIASQAALLTRIREHNNG